MITPVTQEPHDLPRRAAGPGVDESPQKEAVKTQVQLPGRAFRRVGQGRAAVALTARS